MYFKKFLPSYSVHLEEIEKILLNSDIMLGRRIPRYWIGIKEEENFDSNDHIFNFRTYDYNDRNTYNSSIIISNNKIKSINCECFDFKKSKSCKHIAGAFYNYSDNMFYDLINSKVIYNTLLERYKADENEKIIKKELKIEINFVVKNDYQEFDFRRKEFIVVNDLKASIGYLKMYSLNNKFNLFYNTYISNDGICVFGKDLSYNPKEFYFTKENEKLIHQIHLFNQNNYNYDNALKDLINYLISNKIKFSVNGHYIYEVFEKSPLESFVKKDNNVYEINFNYKDLLLLCDDGTYVYYEGAIYILNNKEKSLLLDIIDNELDKIKVEKEEFSIFSNGLLKVIKNNLEVDESASADIVISNLSQTELYFDIYRDEIRCKIIFDYNGQKVNYFDKVDIVRDEDIENIVLNDILNLGFKIEKNSLLLDDIDAQVYFIENDIEKLAEKYKIYTSEKLKKVSIKKKMNIKSSFSIGKDNILSYSFNLDGINSDELVNIFKELKQKKKYYRLKNGDILNLSDETLLELEDLTSELDLTDEQIIEGNGKIQKYRAIFIDSLQSRYNNLKIDNLFKEFVDNFYKCKDSNLTLSTKEMNILRDYQKTGVKWLYNIHKTGFGGILADEMGLGKTIQSIYYIKQILKEDKNSKFLIVVPTSLIYNWEHEFDMYGNNISKTIINGNKKIRQKLIETDSSVYITSYGLLREDIDLYKNKKYHTIFIDEAQSIKNYVAGITKAVKSIDSTTKFALTGTPLENSPLELWSIFDFIMPGYLGGALKFKNRYHINEFNDKIETKLDNLSKVINPFILRRKKMDVTKELPEKMINNIYVELSPEQKKIYVSELDRVQKEIEELLKNNGSDKISFLLLPLLTKLRQICIDPAIIYKDYLEKSNKIETLLLIVKENIANNNKILIFTSFRGAMDIVKRNLEDENIPCYIINGETPAKERMNRVDEFNNRKDAAVFVIMLKSGGTGINLASANVVIHLDLWWNPQAENQATDRAHRIGQTKTVEVIHLITKGTIEERILELQEKKLKLSDKLIDGIQRDKNIISSLTEEEIKKLISYENKD